MKNVDLESLKIGDKVIISDEYVGKQKNGYVWAITNVDQAYFRNPLIHVSFEGKDVVFNTDNGLLVNLYGDKDFDELRYRLVGRHARKQDIVKQRTKEYQSIKERTEKKLSRLMNAEGVDGALNIPDYIIAKYLMKSLDNLRTLLIENDR